MLALRSAQRLARPRARMLSTMVEKVQADITRIKAAAAGSDASSYSVAELEKDMAAGTVDVSKLQDSLSFNVVAQKVRTTRANLRPPAGPPPPSSRVPRTHA
eukprot:2077976-Prymnesium_polylepis.3